MPSLDSFEEVLRAALSLPAESRAMLAGQLLESLNRPNQKQIDAAWAEEIERRIRDIDEGKVETITTTVSTSMSKTNETGNSQNWEMTT